MSLLIEHKNGDSEGSSRLREKELHFYLGGSPCSCTGSCLSIFQHQCYLAGCPASYLPNPQGSSLLGHLFGQERAQAEGTDRWVLDVHEEKQQKEEPGTPGPSQHHMALRPVVLVETAMHQPQRQPLPLCRGPG